MKKYENLVEALTAEEKALTFGGALTGKSFDTSRKGAETDEGLPPPWMLKEFL